MIPDGTTHVWTCAVDAPVVGYIFRRAYYKRVNGVWFSFSLDKEWVPSNNDAAWFDTERNEGYFVTLNDFQSPTFVSKKEVE